MKVAITGTSGLAKNIKDTLEGTAIDGSWIEVVTPRIEDIINNDTKWYGFSQWMFLLTLHTKGLTKLRF